MLRQARIWTASFLAVILAAGCGKKADDAKTTEDDPTGTVNGAGGSTGSSSTTGGLTLSAAAVTPTEASLADTRTFKLTDYCVTLTKLELSLTGEEGSWVAVYDNTDGQAINLISGDGAVANDKVANGTYNFMYAEFSGGLGARQRLFPGIRNGDRLTAH